MTPQQADLDGLIKDLFAWRSLDRGTIVQKLNADPTHTATVNYQRLKELDLVKNLATFPARFLFKGDVLVLIALSDPAVLERFSIDDVRAVFSDVPAALRSPVGRASTVYAYPERGIAFTTRHAEPTKLQYVEVFQPQTLAAYQQTIYADPSASP